ncbi:MAG: thiamine pyrophosphate-dependent enzyme [Burkholderiales bacterium]|nr:thiamine pyrophosphate-dependent enzyme [Burkholderiales bacterium]
MKKYNTVELIQLYKYMLASRESDVVEVELVNSGEANFLASSKGHEGSVILSKFLQASDYLHCHYRDKALMLARGITNKMFFDCALCNTNSHSLGRQMVSHMSAAEYNILSIVGPVGNNALQAAGIAMAIKQNPDNPIVLCAIGDGTSQQGEVLEAIAEAKRNSLPILFFIHNNNYAISTATTGKTFFSLPNGKNANSFYDLPITYIDGINPLPELSKLEQIINTMRSTRQAQIVVFNVDRLDNHSNADDQALYRTEAQILQSLNNDPITQSYNYLIASGVKVEELEKIKQETIKEVRKALTSARKGLQPQATFTASKPLTQELTNIKYEYRGDVNQQQRYTMLEAMKNIFLHQLSTNSNVILLGQDIEDDKGDVFGITRGLSTKFSQRVINTALTESTIVGLSSGLALAGKIPVAFIQFVDFMPLAYNQICSELATMYWRTGGAWNNHVIIFAACGGYRPGLGPFHSQTNEATYAHIPGIDVFMPSNAADAAGMLNAAFKSGRPSVFLYPKKLLNANGIEQTTSYDVHKQLVQIGSARIVRPGRSVTLVGWGNTVALCNDAAAILASTAIEAEVIDLRTIKPYDVNTILTSTNKTGHLVVVHEDNATCGVGGEIIATIVENSKVTLKVKRITKSDTFTPCNFANQLEVLPSVDKILIAVAEMLDLEINYQEIIEDNSKLMIEVIGASPSDESVVINEIHVKVGDVVSQGQILVDIEASKSAGEILSPKNGIVDQIFVAKGDTALVGGNLIALKVQTQEKLVNIVKHKKLVLTRKPHQNKAITPCDKTFNSVGVSEPLFRVGARAVSNQEIIKNFPHKNVDDIERVTGIKQRYWFSANENMVDVATDVAHKILEKFNLKLSDINCIICATSSPDMYQSPSVACLVLAKLYDIYGQYPISAYDISAACSGYLYALQNAYDYLTSRPNERVLLLTAENLSNRINQKDFETAFLFGDAVSATIVTGANHLTEAIATLDKINISAIGECGDVLNIPINPQDGIKLKGKQLFSNAVKIMAQSVVTCCDESNIDLKDIAAIIPHQANQRISSAIEVKLKLPKNFIFSNIAKYGNTSSCTIPIAMAEALPELKQADKIALCAFGAGFTYGAALLTKIK